MDFFAIKKRRRNGVIEIFPDFQVCRSKDLMVRGGSFYAIWDAEAGLWSTDEYDVQRLVDAELREFAKKYDDDELSVEVKYLSNFSSGSWSQFRQYVTHISDSSHQLDSRLTFANDTVEKKDYISKRLPYPLEPGNFSAYDELMSVLYSPEERQKLEWAIGSIVAGDSVSIQKFIVLYGEQGAGKSTFLRILERLFTGYIASFEAKELTKNNNQFSTEAFRSNPLVAIQHDGDLSRIEDNSKLNSIVSHEDMVMNEKYKSSYTSRINAFLFMATNKPVKITDAKSGIIRRLIDVKPSGNKIPPKRFRELDAQINFELGAIAYHCLDIYRSMGRDFYNNYRPVDMMYKTDVFFNFVEASYEFFDVPEGVSLKAAYAKYKEYCDESGAEFKLPMYKFREELKNYFDNFQDVARIGERTIRSYYTGFRPLKFERDMKPVEKKADKDSWLLLNLSISLFDTVAAGYLAQYANSEGNPTTAWDNCKTHVSDIDTTRLHYVLFPQEAQNHIVIDFDIRDASGNKSRELNLAAASMWPPTYAEYSKSGAGIHLHYMYDGDVSKLSNLYSEGIEVKVFTGKASLRRRLTLCNDIPIATISSGLPLKEVKKNVISDTTIKSEKGLRSMIERNLNKEIHSSTKSSIDFIFKILEDAYNGGLHYDVSDMRQTIFKFAMHSTNQSEYCMKLVGKMHFKSEETAEPVDAKKDIIVFFDTEVFSNLLVVCWKQRGVSKVHKMINPTSREIEELFEYKLVGFNNRKYDNHILYARYIGYSTEELYILSQRLIGNSKNACFSEAYNLSYTDILDFSSKKQGLKKFEIDLKIHHKECGIPWDQPAPEDKWDEIADYCANDVEATEAVFEDRKGDFLARQILADLADMTPNDTTNQLTTKIIFGHEKHPQLQYTDLSIEFPGYEYKTMQVPIPKKPGEFKTVRMNMYRGEDAGFGGFVYAVPGMYGRTVTFDVASMHPSSIIALNAFGDYTKRFKELLDARIAIKHKDYELAGSMLDGKLKPYLKDPADAKMLASALKIAINSVYGLTSASFDNPFRDPRNVNNIVALRGALFMINLRDEVTKLGGQVIHIKTDSIKILDPSPEIFDFVMAYGKQYGYNFEIEHIFEKICLVNDAVYIAKLAEDDPEDPGKWTATGAQFAEPYVFKTLFSHEPIEFDDLCSTFNVSKGALYLDVNEDDPENHAYHFVGRTGLFCPIKAGFGGALLQKKTDTGEFAFPAGSKGFRWLEAETVTDTHMEDAVEKGYFDILAAKAIETINEFGDFESFAGSVPPWLTPCGKDSTEACKTCPSFKVIGDKYTCNRGYNIDDIILN